MTSVTSPFCTASKQCNWGREYTKRPKLPSPQCFKARIWMPSATLIDCSIDETAI